MSLVIDASVAVSALTSKGPARDLLSRERLHAPHLVDVEVASVLRRHHQRGTLTDEQAQNALATWAHLGVTRHPMVHTLGRVWELRSDVSAYDATYIALAEQLDVQLVTADARLSRAPGLRCSILLLPA